MNEEQLLAEFNKFATPGVDWESALWGYRKAIESNTETVQKLAKWIRYKGNEYGGDHACKQCYRYSDVLVDGFVCAYHLACALLATTPGSKT